eukprot:2640086-Rhodomonas_salina.1
MGVLLASAPSAAHAAAFAHQSVRTFVLRLRQRVCGCECLIRSEAGRHGRALDRTRRQPQRAG